MTAYTPLTLPPLPRKRCPFEHARGVWRFRSKLYQYMVKAPCTERTLKNGWCAAHQHCQELLECGARLGYPRMQISEYLLVGSGRANWEGYAVVYINGRREQVQRALLRLEGERFNEAPTMVEASKMAERPLL